MIENQLNNRILQVIENSNLKHIAIIMDGNRRWAKLHNLPTIAGHNHGVKSLKNLIETADDWNIKYITAYAFSTENWDRKKEEVDFLMMLIGKTISNEIDELHQKNVKVRIIGDLSELSFKLQDILNSAMDKTKYNTGLNLQMAINYGARREILTSVKKIAALINNKSLKVDDISEDLISQNLYTSDIPDPDLLIRTSGEYRISNYLLWQAAYSEIYITDTLWPDFGDNDLEEAIMTYAKRDRRFGKG